MCRLELVFVCSQAKILFSTASRKSWRPTADGDSLDHFSPLWLPVTCRNLAGTNRLQIGPGCCALSVIPQSSALRRVFDDTVDGRWFEKDD